VPYEAPEVADETVQENLERLRERHAEVGPVERPAQLGDVVTLDAKGYLNTGENPSDFLLADQDVSLVLEETADWPMPGFGAQVVGLSAGEQKTFDLTFADDYPNESLRSQVAHFEVTLKEVKQRTLPEWNDDLAKTIGDYESLDALRQEVRDNLVGQAERGNRREYQDKVLEQLVGQAQIKFPPVLLEQEIDAFLEDLDNRLRQQRLTLEDYLKMQNKTREQVRDEVRPQAEARLKRSLVLGKVVELEGIHLHPEDITNEIDRLSETWGDRSDEIRRALSNVSAMQAVSMDLLTDRAIDRLLAVARGEEVPPPGAGHDHDQLSTEEAAPAEAGQPPMELTAEPTAAEGPEAAADEAASPAETSHQA
jgi:trigger factor